MTISTPIRLLGASALALTLSACMDVSISVDVVSETEAEVTMVTSMPTDVYALIEAQTAELIEEFGEGEVEEDGFCDEGELVEGGETVDCVVTVSGAFEDISLGEGDAEPTITAIGNGQVRVAFPTGDLAESAAEDAGVDEDPQMTAMIAAMFAGHYITMSVSGGAVVDTNMEIAADGQSATYRIHFPDLLAGDLDLPEELFAVVQK